MFELAENRLYAYADDSTLLVVVRKPADRPAAAGLSTINNNQCIPLDSRQLISNAAILAQGLRWDSGVVQSPVHDTEP